MWSWTSTPLKACMARTGTALQITDCSQNTELNSCTKNGFYTLTAEFSSHLVFLDINDIVFSSSNWWIGCCIFLWVCMNPSSFQCHTVRSCLDDVGTQHLIPKFQQQKGRQCPIFFFCPPFLDTTESGAFPFVTFWNTVPKDRKSLRFFHMFVFVWGSLHCFWCTWTC